MENNRVKEQIVKLLGKTKENKLPWKYAGTNIVRWVQQDNDRTFTITVQIQPVPPSHSMSANQRQANYVFTIQATAPNEVILQLNSSADPTLKDLLQELFEEAMKSSKQVSFDLIDKLIKAL